MIQALKFRKIIFFYWMSWIPTSKFFEQATQAMETWKLSSYSIDGIVLQKRHFSKRSYSICEFQINSKIWNFEKVNFVDKFKWIATTKFFWASYFIDGIDNLSQAVAHLKFWFFVILSKELALGNFSFCKQAYQTIS